MIAIGTISAQGVSPPVVVTRIVNINLSMVGRTDDNAAGWNTLRMPNSFDFPISSIPNTVLLDSDGVSTGIQLFGMSQMGNTGTSEANVPQSFPIPQVYVVDFFGGFQAGSNIGVMRFTGLPNVPIDFRFLANIGEGATSRVNINGVYLQNGSQFPTTTSFDDPNYISFNGITPVGGELTFSVDGNTDDYWALLAIRIRFTDTPPDPGQTFRFVNNSDNDSGYGFAESLPSGYDSASAASLPLIVFMHGNDERGNGNLPDLDKLTAWGSPKFAQDGSWIVKDDYIMLAPQSATNGYNLANLHTFLGWAVSNYKVDPSRVYGVGISMGAWDSMSYIGVYGTDSRFTKLVPLSGLLPNYAGGTFLVAAQSQVPVWILTNDGDPSVPFYSPGPYGGVLQTRDSINALNPGQVKVTAFDRDDHTSLWDPVTQGEWQGTEMPAYDPYNEDVYEWLQSEAPPVGRTFNVGSGSGQLLVDGNNAGAAWYPLQHNDTFVVNAGTYQNIRFRNMVVNPGTIHITCNGVVNLTGEGLIFGNAARNVDADFGYQLNCNGDSSAVTLDENALGLYENVRVAGINVNNVGPGQSLLRHRPPNYNNGAGPISSTNIVIENWNINLPGSLYLDGITLGGSIWNNAAYTTRNISPIIRNIRIRGNFECQYPVLIVNGENALISRVDIEDVNTQVVPNLHARLTMILGQGIIERVVARNHMGNAACIWGFYRTGNNPLSIIRNIKAQNSTRYSATEVQGNSSYNVSGVGANTNYFIGGVTADTLDTQLWYAGCAADIYSTHGGSVKVRNVVSINGHSKLSQDQGGGVITQRNAINNNAGTIDFEPSNILVNTYTNRAAAGVNTDLVPQTGSPLIAAGVFDPDLIYDYEGDVRPDPPTIGACEPA